MPLIKFTQLLTLFKLKLKNLISYIIYAYYLVSLIIINALVYCIIFIVIILITIAFYITHLIILFY